MKYLTHALAFYLGGYSLAFTICIAFEQHIVQAAGHAALWPGFIWFMAFGTVGGV